MEEEYINEINTKPISVVRLLSSLLSCLSMPSPRLVEQEPGAVRVSVSSRLLLSCLQFQAILKLDVGLLLHLLCALQSLDQLSLLSLELCDHSLRLHRSSVLLLLLSQIDHTRLFLFAQPFSLTLLERLLSSVAMREREGEREGEALTAVSLGERGVGSLLLIAA
jgi:hypothetical protein